jgi:hypothetical protein
MGIDRHINFFELQKAAARPGCPLCRIVADRTEQYIDNMLFEHISDRGFRKTHRSAGGFCDVHSRKLLSFRDGLAAAILGRDILEDRILFFQKRKPWRPREQCPVCAERDRIEREYLGFLAQCETGAPGGDTANAGELREAFTSSDGLCVPHYGKLLESHKRLPPWISEFHEKKFRDLLTRVNTFIELSAYGRQEEFRRLPEKDQLVWKELTANLRGAVYPETDKST